MSRVGKVTDISNGNSQKEVNTLDRGIPLPVRKEAEGRPWLKYTAAGVLSRNAT